MDYRAYHISEDGHISDFVVLECADDDAATQQAKLLVDHRDVELWEHDQMVAVFKAR